MTTFRTRMRGSGQTRPEGGAHAALGPAMPVGQPAFAGVAVTSPGGPLVLAALYAPSRPLRRAVLSIRRHHGRHHAGAAISTIGLSSRHA